MMTEELLLAPLVPSSGALPAQCSSRHVLPGEVLGEEFPHSSLLTLEPRIIVHEHLCRYALPRDISDLIECYF